MCSDHKSRLQYLWQMSSSRLAPINDRTMLMAGRKSAFGKQLQEMSPTDKNISNRQTTFCWFYVGIVLVLSFPGVIKDG